MPKKDGQLALEHILDETFIQYDANGVAHIQAEEDLDAFFALGFAHAQNRLWQMEMNRKTASGQLSEILGASSLQSDIFMRTLRLQKNAERMWQNLPQREKKVLEHYVQGVNAGIKQLDLLPIEYLLYGFQPKAWTEVDSLLWMQLMTVQLSTNLSAELQRSELIQTVGLSKTNALMAKIADNRAIDRAAANILPTEYLSPKSYIGSNSWVVSGQHTGSGMPLLANDPHLTNSIPSIFYLADINTKQLKVSGATFPGLPFVVIGHNQNIAWGLTNMMADTQDAYLEKINPDNINQYEVDGEYLDMDVTVEQIKIKPGFLEKEKAPYSVVIRRTHRGPLLSDLQGSHNSYAYSLRWIGDEQQGGTFSSFLNINYAQNWQQFNQALSSFVAPIHNFVYADKQGNIGYLAPGKFPKRVHSGAVPAKGWLSESDWQGWIAQNEWPTLFNPESGMIVTANNNVLADDYPYPITSDWAEDYRAKRITHLLKNADRILSVEHFKQIQLDVLHPAKSKLLARMLQIQTRSPQQTEAINLLKKWDGNMQLTSPEASLFAAWTAHFNRLLLEDDSAKSSRVQHNLQALDSLMRQENQKFIETVLLDGQSEWCDYLETAQTIESCDQLLIYALDHALNELVQKLGTDMSTWQWSKLHIAQYPHFPLSDNIQAPHSPKSPDSILSEVFHRSIASPGGGDTVNVAPVSLMEDSRFNQFFGPSYRQIIDLKNDKNSLFSISTGQSGNVLSQHYDDLIAFHHQGKYILLLTNFHNKRLTLKPKIKAN
ncbi:penicillin acylase family protein [Catenovulum sediminis]|uniref:Penicillin acylase family protein n=1 Tax=Catenovulum sediminis TaxID=1740262 RepID=A0ABV1RF39_9ALTE|nr:penicillin acylase family protein [Catenovulum sediminis]